MAQVEQSPYQILMILIALIFFVGGMIFQVYLPGAFISPKNKIPPFNNTNLFDNSYSFNDIGFFKNKTQWDFVRLDSVTDSMSPTFVNGNLLFILFDFEKTDIKPGTIICFNHYSVSDLTVCHRVVDVDVDEYGETIYKTKGDNAPLKDKWILKYEDIRFIIAGVFWN